MADTNTQLNNGSNAGNLPFALEYIQRGWKIFPIFHMLASGGCSCGKATCKRPGKHPCVRNGFQDASNDEAQIREWWTQNKWANIGLATGHGGVIVLDEDCGLDEKTGQPKVGPASLRALIEANAALPETLIANTGSGGRHFYFLTPKEIKNRTDCPGKHLDARGHGGYVLLPGSNHKSGTKYSWATEPDARIADMPEWLENLLMGESNIDISGDIDAEQNEALTKSTKTEKFTEEQLIRLLDFIPPDCDREIWWQVGAALKKELGDGRGWEVWSEWSKKAPEKWDSKTALVQWNSFVDKGLTGGTVYHFAKELGNFQGFDKEAARDPEIVDSWVWTVATKSFVETRRFLEWDREQFDTNFLPLFTRGRPSEHVLRSKAFRRVDGCTYWPNQPLYVEEYGQSKLNYWRPSDIKPAPGDVSLFLNHVSYLFPDEGEANILLDYLAFQVQHPGEKVHWAVLMQGDQGNGKSFFGVVMRLVLGAHNVRMATNEQLHETFTQYQRNTQLIIIEELMAKGRLELMNKLKPMITESWCTIREMYKPPYEQPNRFNFLFFSNHKDPIIIDNTDRRYCILKSNAPPHPDANAYYAPLFDWARANASVISHYLHNRPLTNFKPQAHAPMTEGKRALIKTSMPPIDQHIYDHVGAGEWPCKWDLLTPSVLIRPLKEEANLGTVNAKLVSDAFERLGYLKLDRQRVSLTDFKVNLWAVRNFGTYKDMTNDQLRQAWAEQTKRYTDCSQSIVDALYEDRAGGQAHALMNQKPM